MSHANIWGNSIPTRETTECKGSEEDICRARSRDIEEAKAAGAVCVELATTGGDFGDVKWRTKSQRTL